MRTMKDTGLLFQRHFTQQVRNPTWLFVGLSSPVLYLALFTPLLKHLTGAVSTGAVLDTFFPGILALLAYGSGSAQGFGTIFELRSGVIERLRVTPASRFAILAGPLVSAMTFMRLGSRLGDERLPEGGRVILRRLTCPLQSAATPPREGELDV